MKTAVAAVRTDYSAREFALKGALFARMLQSVELLHRRFLDVVTAELGRRGKALSSVQALILSHISEPAISLGQLQALGHYEGASLAYNVGKLAENGYITLSRPQWDRRSSLIELTETGREVAALIAETLDHHARSLAGIGIDDEELTLVTHALKGLNRLWSS